MFENFSLIRRLSQIGTWLQIFFCGILIGEDGFGNRYYQESKKVARPRRWVWYKGEPDTSKVPPEWHGWLHYSENEPIKPDSPFCHPWQKPHRPNLSGTPDANRPAWPEPKDQPTNAYQAWKP
jgi:NADH:ubiquinone oxidoreductase subunit